MTTATLADTMLADARAEVAQDHYITTDLESETGELLDGIERFLKRYVVLPSEQAASAVALFVLHTWALEAADATPYLVVVSEEKRSGKTRLLEVLELLIRSPWRTASTTEAALVRKISSERPTLLLDEIDAIFGGASRTEALRGVLNAGNRRGNTITRCEGKGTQEFPTFCAKVLAGIDTGTLPDTITDRSVVVQMRRRDDDEPVERLRARKAEMQAEPIRGALALWANAATPQLALAYPDLPSELTDRSQDAWEPLLAIGELAGTIWSAKAYEAARVLSRAAEEERKAKVPLIDAIRSAVGTPDDDPSDAETWAIRTAGEQAERRAKREERDSRQGTESRANCASCGRYKSTPAEPCHHCGNDPVPIGEDPHAFNRAHGGAY